MYTTLNIQKVIRILPVYISVIDMWQNTIAMMGEEYIENVLKIHSQVL